MFCSLPLSVTDVTFVPVSRLTGRAEVEEVVAAVRPNTCLISIMLANNETGVIMVRDGNAAASSVGELFFDMFLCQTREQIVLQKKSLNFLAKCQNEPYSCRRLHVF